VRSGVDDDRGGTLLTGIRPISVPTTAMLARGESISPLRATCRPSGKYAGALRATFCQEVHRCGANQATFRSSLVITHAVLATFRFIASVAGACRATFRQRARGGPPFLGDESREPAVDRLESRCARSDCRRERDAGRATMAEFRGFHGPTDAASRLLVRRASSRRAGPGRVPLLPPIVASAAAAILTGWSIAVSSRSGRDTL
jgi:hypothetical protein